MKYQILAPRVGESIAEVSILKWLKKNGQTVKTGDLLLEIESDKATVEIIAEGSGALTISKSDGERVPVGEIIGFIDDAAQGSVQPSTQAPAPVSTGGAPTAVAATMPSSASLGTGGAEGPIPGPATRKLGAELGVDLTQVPGTGKDGRVTQGDLLGLKAKTQPEAKPETKETKKTDQKGDRRVPMSNLRLRIADRLVQAQHTAAILTTFNEVDMSPVMALRNQNKDAFKTKHGIALSFMSFFTRGCVEALKIIPEVNASMDGKDMIYHDYQDIGVAVGTERGLVVPIVRDAGKMNFVEIEKRIAELALKAREGKLSIADMSGGTFTISNGGTYGSLLSTPILTPPQSGILGMHKIQERPVAINGKVEIRPMMYLALSYDHRLIDGKGAVTFLVTLKDFLEHPEKLGFAL